MVSILRKCCVCNCVCTVCLKQIAVLSVCSSQQLWWKPHWPKRALEEITDNRLSDRNQQTVIVILAAESLKTSVTCASSPYNDYWCKVEGKHTAKCSQCHCALLEFLYLGMLHWEFLLYDFPNVRNVYLYPASALWYQFNPFSLIHKHVLIYR